MGESPFYVTIPMVLVANVPIRAPQEAQAFSVINAPFPDAISVSYDQGGFGILPVGLSLENDVHTPLYVVSTVDQSIVMAFSGGGAHIRDTRSGATDSNGNLLVQSGGSPQKTFNVNVISALPAAPTLLLGLYGGAKTLRIRKLLGNAFFGPNGVTLARFTGAPAASGTIGAMESGDVSTYTLSTNQVAGWVITDTIIPEILTGNTATELYNLSQFAKVPTARPGEGIGFFDLNGTGLQDFYCAAVWTEE